MGLDIPNLFFGKDNIFKSSFDDNDVLMYQGERQVPVPDAPMIISDFEDNFNTDSGMWTFTNSGDAGASGTISPSTSELILSTGQVDNAWAQAIANFTLGTVPATGKIVLEFKMEIGYTTVDDFEGGGGFGENGEFEGDASASGCWWEHNFAETGGWLFALHFVDASAEGVGNTSWLTGDNIAKVYKIEMFGDGKVNFYIEGGLHTTRTIGVPFLKGPMQPVFKIFLRNAANANQQMFIHWIKGKVIQNV